MSVKKSLGTAGCVVIFVISMYAVYKDVSLTGIVLGVLSGLVFALFGLKVATGAIMKSKNVS